MTFGWFGGAIAAILTIALQPPPSAQRTLEYEVKSAFLYNFLSFVEWPPAAFASPAAPLTVCLLEGDPFRGGFDAAVRGETLEGRPIEVVRLQEGAPASRCHVLFVPAGREPRLALRAPELRGAPVLIVGESSRVFAFCGALAFVVEGERVRFEANTAGFTERHLKASSKLLRVARSTVQNAGGCR